MASQLTNTFKIKAEGYEYDVSEEQNVEELIAANQILEQLTFLSIMRVSIEGAPLKNFRTMILKRCRKSMSMRFGFVAKQ